MIYPLENPPATDKAGFANMLKMAANAITNGNPQEAGYLLSDIIDTFSPERVLFAYSGGDTYKPRKKKPEAPNPRGTMTDSEWSRIVD